MSKPAAKYKEYSHLKAQESPSNNQKEKENELPHSKNNNSGERSKRRKHSSPKGPEQSQDHDHGHGQTTSTPRKKGKDIFQTPSKARTAHPANVDPYDSPSVLRRLFSPSTHMQSSSPLKTAIGPTPQRDGKALGLFDLLSESGGSTATPSATRIASVKGMSAQTPSKKRKTMDTIAEEEGEEEAASTPRGERTPASSGKIYDLSALFATPTAWKYSSIVEDEASKGTFGNNRASQPNPQPPTNTDPANLETPSFLRRSTSGIFGSSNPNANAGGLSPILSRKPQQFVGKGLSQIVQGLRDMEEERLDDDLDALREMENEQQGTGVEVADSQIPADPTTQGRTYKKKGQKRTTRLVRMKPVVAPKPAATKPQSQPQRQSQRQPRSIKPSRSTPIDEDGSGDTEPEESDDDLVAITETQTEPASLRPRKEHEANVAEEFEEGDWDSLHSISEAEAESGMDSDPDYDAVSKPLGRTKSFSEKMKEAIENADEQSKGSHETKQPQQQEKKKRKEKEKENVEKNPSTRKINPQAHANYRSLKIRNRGGGRGRGFGRFRRR